MTIALRHHQQLAPSHDFGPRPQRVLISLLLSDISCKHLRDEDKYWGLSSVIANGDEGSMEIVEITSKQKHLLSICQPVSDMTNLVPQFFDYKQP